jgi:hypothetical protein
MAFFRMEKPKPFTFVPRFYDERKEELESRMSEIKKEIDENRDDQYVPNIRGRMRSRHDALYGKAGKPTKSLISRRLITIILIALVLIIGYYILRILVVVGKI